MSASPATGPLTLLKPSADPMPTLGPCLFINRPSSHLLHLPAAPHPSADATRIPFPAKGTAGRRVAQAVQSQIVLHAAAWTLVGGPGQLVCWAFPHGRSNRLLCPVWLWDTELYSPAVTEPRNQTHGMSRACTLKFYRGPRVPSGFQRPPSLPGLWLPPSSPCLLCCPLTSLCLPATQGHFSRSAHHKSLRTRQGSFQNKITILDSGVRVWTQLLRDHRSFSSLQPVVNEIYSWLLHGGSQQTGGRQGA